MNHLKNILVTALFFILIFPIVSSAETNLVINGLPTKKVMSDIEGTELVNLTEDESNSYRLLITKRGNKYVWTSREDRELIFSHSGEFYNFVEPNGAGYIRMAKAENKIFYVEHLTLGFKNITYWGIAKEFNVD